MGYERINLELPESLSDYVSRMVAEGHYNTADEFIRDVLCREMARNDIAAEANRIGEAVLAGYQDFAAGRYIESTGNFESDMALFAKREAAGWK